jgi:pantoate--beta-alanine ligase
VIVARTIAEARAALAELPRPLGLVPTMGALHQGHLALVHAAHDRCATVVASLFVNPTQFAPDEDFARYPRDETRDLELFEKTGVGVVFAPAAGEMYSAAARTIVHVSGPLNEKYEAEERPGHFDGVATVVVKLLDVVQPDAGFFGEKDAQQLALIRRVVRDLDLPVEVTGVATVREPDGLAMSSRNAYLTPDQRAIAPDLYRALLAGRAAALEPGGTPKDAIVAAAMLLALPDRSLPTEDDRLRELKGSAPPEPPRIHIEYLDIVDADTFGQDRALGPRSLMIACGRLGTTRLLDNVSLVPVAVDASRAGRPPAATSVPDPAAAMGAYPAADATR